LYLAPFLPPLALIGWILFSPLFGIVVTAFKISRIFKEPGILAALFPLALASGVGAAYLFIPQSRRGAEKLATNGAVFKIGECLFVHGALVAGFER
jgi:hypothetical protein